MMQKNTTTAAKIRLGDLDLTRIGLGTNRLNHTPENVQFVKDAVSAGVQMIDSAYIYAGGESEETIGEALSAKPHDTVVATKGGYNGGRPEVIASEIDESLRRLNTDVIDLYYLHKLDTHVPIEESLQPIRKAQQAGKVHLIGVSNVNVEQLERARRVIDVAAVQNHYNLRERSSDAVIDYCDREGIVFVPYFPLREKGGRDVVEIAQRHHATPSQVILAWLLRRSPCTLPIPGTLSVAHLKENLGALDIELTDADFAALN